MAKQAGLILNRGAEQSKETAQAFADCLPKVNGIDNDLFSVTACSIEVGGFAAAAGLTTAEFAWSSVETWADVAKEIQERAIELDLLSHESNAELRQMGREMQASLREEETLRLELFLAADEFAGAQSDYDAVVQRASAS